MDHDTEKAYLLRQGAGCRLSLPCLPCSQSVRGDRMGQNRHDGSVEMEVQGKEESIDAVILSIEKSNYIVIENFDSKKIPLKEERGFIVKDD